ncbi:MAG: hypothetical protein JWN23_1543 [Rhodocyclales bacterium]|nr:hypothetical protein [Rhodocyclales bacterium]
MATNFTTLYDDVMPEVPGAGTAIVLHALRRAARDFCADSKVDRVDLTPITTIAGTADYALTMPADTDLVEVLKVKRSAGDCRTPWLKPVLVDQMWDETDTGRPLFYSVSQDDVLTLIPKPNAASSIIVTVALAPLMTANTIRDQLALDWGQVIAMGAKAMLMSMPKKLWTEPAAAQHYRYEFEAEKAKARLSGVRGKTRAPFRTVPATIMGR